MSGQGTTTPVLVKRAADIDRIAKALDTNRSELQRRGAQAVIDSDTERALRHALGIVFKPAPERPLRAHNLSRRNQQLPLVPGDLYVCIVEASGAVRELSSLICFGNLPETSPFIGCRRLQVRRKTNIVFSS
jgi:hypothetical protein